MLGFYGCCDDYEFFSPTNDQVDRAAANDFPFKTNADRRSGPTHSSSAFVSQDDATPNTSRKIAQPPQRSNHFQRPSIASQIGQHIIRDGMLCWSAQCFCRHGLHDGRR
jgi:hypothetical protein